MNRKRKLFVLALAGVLLSGGINAAEPAVPEALPEIACAKVKGAIMVDGKLDEPEWKDAPAIELKHYWGAKTGDVAPESVGRVRFLHDKQFLYCSFDLPATNIHAQVGADDQGAFDYVELMIEWTGDARYIVEVQGHPALAKPPTLLLFNPQPGDPLYKQLNGSPVIIVGGYPFTKLKTVGHVDGTINNSSDTDKRWTCEIAVPFEDLYRHCMRVPDSLDNVTWRVHPAQVVVLPDGKAPCLGAKRFPRRLVQ